jgi:ABC-type phosphate/phosphonate transport system, periplasmic component
LTPRLVLTIAALVLALAAPARGDYRETVRTLRIGVVDGQIAAADPARIDAVEKAFADAVGIAVEIVRFPDFSALIDAHASARIQYAIHSAMSYAATEAACGCILPLRRPVSGNGTIGFRSVLVVRESAGSDPGALRIAYSSEGSVSGWEVPREAMASGSLSEPALVRAGSVEAAIDLYLDRSVDGFFAWIPEIAGKAPSAGPADLFGAAYTDKLASGEATRTVWLSEPIVNGPHALHRSVPEDLAAALAAFLDEMPVKAPGLLDIVEPLHSGGFVAAAPEDYRTLRPLVEKTATR